jgi:membrane associated rhomboid family serine protease
MFPLRDVIPSRTTPGVTIGLIAVNAAVFVWQLTLPEDLIERWFLLYGLVPADFNWPAAFTSMFLHAGWWHVGGNLLFLWIFGDNVEDRMGHARFLVFYLLAGVAAALAQTWASPESVVPLVGASGAIAGVMGAYLVLFPHSRVLVLVFLFLFVDVVEIPAVFFLGLWFVMQLVLGVGRTAADSAMGGVAYWAHAAGFLAGIIGVWFFRRSDRRQWEA